MSSAEYRPDREINVRMLIRLILGLLVLVLLSFVAMWKLSGFLFEGEIAADPPPPSLPEARIPQFPPAPRLQAEPLREFADYRTATETQLHTYGWSDEALGRAHIPIARAMDLVLEKGLPDSLSIVAPVGTEPPSDTQPEPES